ncbi:MAG: hypothetical protein WAL86_15015, partial [Candidatus Acidiferrales bacterium]
MPIFEETCLSEGYEAGPSGDFSGAGFWTQAGTLPIRVAPLPAVEDRPEERLRGKICPEDP